MLYSMRYCEFLRLQMVKWEHLSNHEFSFGATLLYAFLYETRGQFLDKIWLHTAEIAHG
jgi:hypothetical protein